MTQHYFIGHGKYSSLASGCFIGTALIHVEGENNRYTWDWLPFPCAVPWRDIVLSIPFDKYMDDPVKSLNELMSNVTEERLLHLQRASLHYAADIDWTAHNSRVLENFLRESYHIPCRIFEESIGSSESVPFLEQPWCIPQKSVSSEKNALSK